MKPEPIDAEDKKSLASVPNSQLQEWVAQAQHDFRNPLGNILGFCEILIKRLEPLRDEELTLLLQSIDEVATQMLIQINQILDPDGRAPGPEEVKALKASLEQHSSRMMSLIQGLTTKASHLQDDLLNQDLCRMEESAHRLTKIIATALSPSLC